VLATPREATLQIYDEYQLYETTFEQDGRTDVGSKALVATSGGFMAFFELVMSPVSDPFHGPLRPSRTARPD